MRGWVGSMGLLMGSVALAAPLARTAVVDAQLGVVEVLGSGFPVGVRVLLSGPSGALFELDVVGSTPGQVLAEFPAPVALPLPAGTYTLIVGTSPTNSSTMFVTVGAAPASAGFTWVDANGVVAPVVSVDVLDPSTVLYHDPTWQKVFTFRSGTGRSAAALGFQPWYFTGANCTGTAYVTPLPVGVSYNRSDEGPIRWRWLDGDEPQVANVSAASVSVPGLGCDALPSFLSVAVEVDVTDVVDGLPDVPFLPPLRLVAP